MFRSIFTVTVIYVLVCTLLAFAFMDINDLETFVKSVYWFVKSNLVYFVPALIITSFVKLQPGAVETAGRPAVDDDSFGLWNNTGPSINVDGTPMMDGGMMDIMGKSYGDSSDMFSSSDD